MLLEVANFGVLMNFASKFKDLNEAIDFTPVVELAEGLAVVQEAYDWVDSLR